MLLYITRHGETTWNVEDKACGRPDVELANTYIQARILLD